MNWPLLVVIAALVLFLAKPYERGAFNYRQRVLLGRADGADRAGAYPPAVFLGAAIREPPSPPSVLPSSRLLSERGVALCHEPGSPVETPDVARRDTAKRRNGLVLRSLDVPRSESTPAAGAAPGVIPTASGATKHRIVL